MALNGIEGVFPNKDIAAYIVKAVQPPDFARAWSTKYRQRQVKNTPRICRFYTLCWCEQI